VETIIVIGSLLKYLGALLALFVGLLVLHTKIKDDTTGKLTRPGKFYRVLIVLAGLTVIGVQVVDDVRSARARRQQELSTQDLLTHNAQLLEEVIRGQYPLQNLKLTYAAVLPLSDRGTAAYETRLASQMPSLQEQLLKRRQVAGARFWVAVSDAVQSVTFCSDSPLFPRSSGPEQSLRKVVEGAGVRLLLYRTPVEITRAPLFVWTGFTAVQSDIEMTFPPDNPCVEYRPREHILKLHGVGLHTNSEQWQSSGRILSLLDLRDAQLIVDMHPRRSDDAAFTQPEIETVELQVGALDSLWLPRSRLIAHSLPNGDAIYEFKFPSKLEEILALQRRY